jgi:glycogen debranching enzyme
LQQARELFGAVDVMMNCMLVDNLDEMSQLARHLGKVEDARYFSKYARDVETKILDEMWFDGQPDRPSGFYAQNNQGQPINEVSINNLFPLTLPNLKENQLESLIGLMDRSFNTPYTLPTVATDSPNYDPHNRESDRLWQGPVWENANWYLVVRGLAKQLRRTQLMSRRPGLKVDCEHWAKRISVSSRRLLDMNGPREYYDPTNGRALRPRVKNFGWSNLGYVMGWE